MAVLWQLSQDPDRAANIVSMLGSFTFRNHLCISFELLSINLYEVRLLEPLQLHEALQLRPRDNAFLGALQYIRSKLFRGVAVSIVRRIASQVLVALRALAAQHIVHCDLKPENILLNSANSLGVTVRSQTIRKFISSTLHLADAIYVCRS